jgi:hypothetical protein
MVHAICDVSLAFIPRSPPRTSPGHQGARPACSPLGSDISSVQCKSAWGGGGGGGGGEYGQRRTRAGEKRDRERARAWTVAATHMGRGARGRARAAAAHGGERE